MRLIHLFRPQFLKVKYRGELPPNVPIYSVIPLANKIKFDYEGFDIEDDYGRNLSLPHAYVEDGKIKFSVFAKDIGLTSIDEIDGNESIFLTYDNFSELIDAKFRTYPFGDRVLEILEMPILESFYDFWDFVSKPIDFKVGEILSSNGGQFFSFGTMIKYTRHDAESVVLSWDNGYYRCKLKWFYKTDKLYR